MAVLCQSQLSQSEGRHGSESCSKCWSDFQSYVRVCSHTHICFGNREIWKLGERVTSQQFNVGQSLYLYETLESTRSRCSGRMTRIEEKLYNFDARHMR